MKKISCVICAYNEEPRLEKVLKAVESASSVDEIIVVNDGSSDGTADVVRSHKKIRLIDLSQNQGKTNALIRGLSETKNQWVLLLDADLNALTAKDINALTQPILENQADFTVSLRANALWIHKLIGLDFCSGERVFNKDVLKGKESLLKKLPRFGFEVFLNEQLIRTKARVKVIRWQKVTHARKAEKRGYWKGQWDEFKMVVDVLKTVGLPKIISQNRNLLKQARGD